MGDMLGQAVLYYVVAVFLLLKKVSWNVSVQMEQVVYSFSNSNVVIPAWTHFNHKDQEELERKLFEEHRTRTF